MPALIGVGLAPDINWFHTALLAIGVYITYTIAHCIHDLGHADSSYITFSPKGLKILIAMLSTLSIGFIIYFTIVVSPWVLAFAVTLPLWLLYHRRLVYTPFALSGGVFVLVLGGYFIMTTSISLPVIFVGLAISVFSHGLLGLYQMDTWMVEPPSNNYKLYSHAVYHLILMSNCLLLLAIAFLID